MKAQGKRFPIFSHLGRWRWPARCVVCHAWPSDTVCEGCLQDHAQPHTRCPLCAAPMQPEQEVCSDCLGNGKPPLAQCYAALPYQWPWRDLIDTFKYRAQPSWAGLLAQRMAACPEIRHTLQTAAWVLPMPIHPERLAERGYHQTLLLAQRLLALTGTAPHKLQPDLLVRSRNVARQSTLTSAQRADNLHHVFSVPHAPARALVHGQHVVLVDDVMTTGATLQHAATALLAAGATQVSAVVVARAAIAAPKQNPSHAAA